jgi:DUF1980 C-terminal domain
LLRVRAALFIGATLAVATLTSPDSVRSALAASSSALVEAIPFLLAGVLLERALRRGRHVFAYAGCGCASGPSARSLPVAAATWLLFGPLVAIARYAAALLVARALRRRLETHGDNDASHLLGELAALFPAAVLAGASTQLLAAFDPARLPPALNALFGATLGFTAPCGLGAIAIAGALKFRAPVAAAAFLCVAGIVDLRAIGANRSRVASDEDGFSYALLAVALGLVAWRRGGALVHPAFTVALWGCAAVTLAYAVYHRRRQSASARIAPALMLAGVLIGAPPPAYHATETTLTDLFAGERLTFTGALSCERDACAIVRYAITCCRADAAPIAIRLDRAPPYVSGTWLRIDGRIESVRGELRLVPEHIERVSPPSDPFIYR